MDRRGWVLCGTLVGTFVAYQALEATLMRGMFVTVPEDRDPRLVGKWKGVWKGKFPGTAEVLFRPDGTVEGPFFDRARWGTERGLLQIKTLETDYWRGLVASYSVAPNGRAVELRPRRNHSVPNQMTKPYRDAETFSASQGGLPMLRQTERRRLWHSP